MRKHGTLVKIEEGRDLFLVNGVTVPKDFLHTLFAFVDQVDADKAPPYDKLIAYLSLVPLVQGRAEHFLQHHSITAAAKLALELATPIYKALDLCEQTERSFITACMQQLDIEIEHVCNMGHHIFGSCNEDEDGMSHEGNVIPFRSRAVN